MYLKRLWDFSGPQPRCTGVVILRASEMWKISTRLFESGKADGWIAAGEGKIRLLGDRILIYNVEREPGYYCCHCGKQQANEVSARAHVSSHHGGVPSPDNENPNGYERINYYDCKLEA